MAILKVARMGHPVLRTTLKHGGPVTIEVFDAAGALMTTDRQFRATGLTDLPIDLPSMSGIALLRITTPDGVWPLRWVNVD